MINLWIFSACFYWSRTRGEKCAKNPRGLTDFFSLSLVLTFRRREERGESGDVGLSEKDWSGVCLFYALSLLIGLYTVPH